MRRGAQPEFTSATEFDSIQAQRCDADVPSPLATSISVDSHPAAAASVGPAPALAAPDNDEDMASGRKTVSRAKRAQSRCRVRRSA